LIGCFVGNFGPATQRISNPKLEASVFQKVESNYLMRILLPIDEILRVAFDVGCLLAFFPRMLPGL
jgi:hypothetical protein